MSARIAWTGSTSSQRGFVGGLRLFTISFGLTRSDTMYELGTTLPVKSRLVGQHYADSQEAKAAAEKILAAFIARIQEPTEADR